MKKERLEVYSDGVMAIIATIMVLELKIPHGEEWSDLGSLLPVFLSYVISFNNISLFWYMHHNMFHDVGRINTRILLANLQLLFYLSLIPFVTGWMGENNFAPVPLAAYSFILFVCTLCALRLRVLVVKSHGKNLDLIKRIGSKRQLCIFLLCYGLGVPLAFLGYVILVLSLFFTVIIIAIASIVQEWVKND